MNRHASYRLRRALVALMLATLVGCQSGPPLPTYDAADLETTWQTIQERSDAIQTVRSEVWMSIDPPDGREVSFEGAVAVRRPDMMRMQAWKFDRPVLDLTINPQGTWLWLTPRARAEGGEQVDFDVPHGRFAEWIDTIFSPLGSESGRVIESRRNSKYLEFRTPFDEQPGWTVVTRVHRPSRTIRQQRVLDDEGRRVAVITYDRYRVIEGFAMATRLRLVGDWEAEVRLQDPTLNDSLPDSLFKPRTDAEKLP